MNRDKEYDEVLRSRISEILDETIDESMDADDLMFDLDGTLFCESDPLWFDFMMYRYRILEDPTYIDKATEHEKEVANTIQSIIDTGVVPEGFEIEIGHRNRGTDFGETSG